MSMLKIKLYGDACQILEQTERMIKSCPLVFRASNGKNVYCYDYPDYIPPNNNILLRGAEAGRDYNVFKFDRDYLKALDEFCEHFDWRFVICI